MARSLLSTIAAAQRDANRARAARSRAQVAAVAQAQRAQAAAVREAERARAALDRAARADARERARLYAESRAADVAAYNARIEQTLSDLSSILATALATDAHIDLDSLKQPPALPA